MADNFRLTTLDEQMRRELYLRAIAAGGDPDSVLNEPDIVRQGASDLPWDRSKSYELKANAPEGFSLVGDTARTDVAPDPDSGLVEYLRVNDDFPPQAGKQSDVVRDTSSNASIYKDDRLPAPPPSADARQSSSERTAEQLAAAKAQLEWNRPNFFELDPYGPEGIKPVSILEKTSPFGREAPLAVVPLAREQKDPSYWDRVNSNLNASASSFVNGVPIIGPYLDDGLNHVEAGLRYPFDDKPYQEKLDEVRAKEAQDIAANPKTSAAAGVAGNVGGSVAAILAAPEVLGFGGAGLLVRSAASGLTNLAVGATDRAVRSKGDWQAIKGGMFTDVLTGSVLPGLGQVVGPAVAGVAKAATPLVGEAVANTAAKYGASSLIGGGIGGIGAGIDSGGDLNAIKSGIYRGLVLGAVAPAAVSGARQLRAGYRVGGSPVVADEERSQGFGDKSYPGRPPDKFHVEENKLEKNPPQVGSLEDVHPPESKKWIGWRKTVPTGLDGKVLRDIDGRPIYSEDIVGVQEPNGPNVALTMPKKEALVQNLLGRPWAFYYPGDSSVKGVFRRETPTGNSGIFLNARLNVADQPKTLAHETGHLLDDMDGNRPIPPGETYDQYAQLYHDQLHESMKMAARTKHGLSDTVQITPEHFYYRPEQVPREFRAEAVKAYKDTPAALKAKYPLVAADIRKFNDNPKINKFIHFNGFGGLILPPAAAAALAELERKGNKNKRDEEL